MIAALALLAVPGIVEGQTQQAPDLFSAVLPDAGAESPDAQDACSTGSEMAVPNADALAADSLTVNHHEPDMHDLTGSGRDAEGRQVYVIRLGQAWRKRDPDSKRHGNNKGDPLADRQAGGLKATSRLPNTVEQRTRRDGMPF